MERRSFFANIAGYLAACFMPITVKAGGRKWEPIMDNRQRHHAFDFSGKGNHGALSSRMSPMQRE